MSGSDRTGVPPALVGHLRELNALFETLRHESWRPRTPTDFALLPPSAYRVLTIAGGRGAGKTTLMRLFARDLASRKDVVVLPPLEPELFGASDSVFSAVVTRLQALVHQVAEESLSRSTVMLGAGQAPLNLAQALDRLLRHTALVRDANSLNSLAAPSLEQYSSDFVKHALAGEAFTQLWDSAIDACSDALTAPDSRKPVIMIPIDDPDLAPTLLPKLLQDVRIVARTPHVVACVCLDLPEARRALSARYVQSLGVPLATGETWPLVEGQLTKALPPQLRVVLGDLSQDERLAFKPIAEEGPSLLEVLRTFTTRAQPEAFALGDLFVLPNGRPSSYAECLPAVPREAETLLYSLKGLLNASEGEAVAQAARIVVETAVQGGFQRTPIPGIDPARLCRFAGLRGGESRPQLTLDLSRLVYFRSSTTAEQVYTSALGPENVTVAFGTLGRVSGRITRPDDDEEEGPLLDPALSTGLLLAREFTQFGDVFDESVFGGEPVTGGRPGTLLNLRVGTVRADSFFAVLPTWKAYYDYFVFEDAWRASLDRVSLFTEGLTRDPPAAVPLLILTYLRLVGETQSDRCARPLETSELEDILHGPVEPSLESVWEQTQSAISRAFETATASGRSAAFRDWVARFVPLICHPWLLPHGLIEEILTARANLVGASLSVRAELARLIENRIRAHLGEVWITPLFEVFGDMPDMKLDSVRSYHEAALRERDRPARLSGERREVSQHPPAVLAKRAISVLRQMLSEERDRLSAEEIRPE